MHLIMDGLLDLAMNALEWNRDLTLPVYDIRKQETGMQDKPDEGYLFPITSSFQMNRLILTYCFYL